MGTTRSTRIHRTAALVAAGSLLFSACASSRTETTVAEVAAEPDTSRVIETWDNPGENEIQLLVSNQSSIDMAADLTFEVDGVLVIAQRFETLEYHNFFAFNINGVEPGEHTITVRSDDGQEDNVVFEKSDDPVWIVVHYWPEESGTGFIQQIENEPVEFA